MRRLLLLLLLLLLVPWGVQAHLVLDATHPLARGLLAWYPVLPHLTNGLRWYDVVSRLHGANVGSPLWTEAGGRFAGALGLNGAQYSDIGNVAPLNFERTQPFSLALWFRTLAGLAGLIVKAIDVDPFQGYWLSLYSDGSLHLYLADSAGGNLDAATTGLYHDGLWHQAVATYDGSSTGAGIQLYVDGKPDLEGVAGPGLAATMANSVALRLGTDGSQSASLVGRLTNVMFYNRVLPASEVQTLYQMQAPTYGGLLVEEPLPLVQAAPRIKRKGTIQ